MPGEVRVDGLIELQRSLKAIDGEAQKELRVVLNKSAEIVAAAARLRAPVRSGKLRASIRVSSQQRSAGISEGKANVPYAGFIDYGNKVHSGAGVGRGDSQRREFIPTGRIMYPAFLEKRDLVMETLTKDMAALIEKHGLDVT